MFRYIALMFLAIGALCLGGGVVAAPAEASPVLTKPEMTDFKETNSFADMMSVIRQMQKRSDRLRVETIIQTAEGKQVPMIVLGDPLPAGPAEARLDPRPVVYIQGNIHAGEVEGKDALLILMRDMLIGEKRDLLKGAIYLFVPIFNADSNDRMSPKNRSYMPNPEKGVGLRPNSQNYDLNRDYIKTESREVRAILERVILPWDPLLYVDLHTTDGSFHRETVTYSSPRGPNWDPTISSFLWDNLYPAVDAALRSNGVKALPYGDFIDDAQPEKGWGMFPPTLRMGMDYMGMRNRFSVLVEMYAYAPYRTRVEHCYAFLVELLRFTAVNSAKMKELALQADRASIGYAALPVEKRPAICLKTSTQPVEKPLTIETFEVEKKVNERGRPWFRPILDKPKTCSVPYLAKFLPAAERPLPWAYLLKPGCDQAVRQLLRHGIRVERVLEPVQLAAQKYQPTAIKPEPFVGEGHIRLNAEGGWVDTSLDVEPGWFIVHLNQPLCMLSAHLLEPDMPDSLVTWNFFNNWVAMEWSRELPALPYYRVMNQTPVSSEGVSARDLEY